MTQKLFLVLLLGFLSSCTFPHATFEQRLDYARHVCAQSGRFPESRDEFMKACIESEIGTSAAYASAPVYSTPANPSFTERVFRGLAAGAPSNPYGPDAFGPMGVWGPTWTEFNGAVRQPQRPTMIVPLNGQSPVLLMPQ